MHIAYVLVEFGHATVEAVDGRAALPILRSDAKIDIMIADVGPLGLNGRQLALIASEHRPDLRVLSPWPMPKVQLLRTRIPVKVWR